VPPPRVAGRAAEEPRSLDGRRDPFWPPDYVQPISALGDRTVVRDAARAGENEWRAMEKYLRETVKSVGRVPGKNGQSVFVAMINGKYCQVGDVVSLTANGKTCRWKIVDITIPDGPRLERVVPSPSVVAPPAKGY